MPYKNPKDLLLDAVKFPTAVEEKLPAGAPKISTMLTDAANQIPAVPDLPMEIPDLPAPPALPEMPGMPELGMLGGRKYVKGVELTRVQREREVIPSPVVGVLPERVQRRGF